MYTEKSDSVT